jgi:hypothetical protein
MLKRKRATNFGFSEKELLLKLCLKNKKVLENKCSNSVTWKDKEKVWADIESEFNCQTMGSVSISIKLQYNLMLK